MSAAVPDMMLEWTSFSGVNPRGQRRRGRLTQFVETLTTPRTVRVKEAAPGFAPTIYLQHYVVPATARHGSFTVAAPSAYRCAEGVAAITALVLDLDHHAPDWSALVASGNLIILYTTWSHAQGDPRWRLVVPLATPIGVEAQAALWFRGVGRFAPLADSSCKDPSRFYFVHSAPPGRVQDAEVRILEGEPWAPSDLAAQPRSSAAFSYAQTSTSGTSLPVGHAAHQFIECGAPIGEQRWHALATARNLLSAGYSVEDAVGLVWRGLECSPQEPGREAWTPDDAERIVCDLASREPTPLRPDLRVRIAHASQPARLIPRGTSRETFDL